MKNFFFIHSMSKKYVQIVKFSLCAFCQQVKGEVFLILILNNSTNSPHFSVTSISLLEISLWISTHKDLLGQPPSAVLLL